MYIYIYIIYIHIYVIYSLIYSFNVLYMPTFILCFRLTDFMGVPSEQNVLVEHDWILT